MKSMDQTIALAGVMQSSMLVHELARTGHCAAAPLQTCLHSVLQIDAETAEGVYDGINGLRAGLELFQEELRRNTARREPEIRRYCAGVLYLERRLSTRREIANRLHKGIEAAQAQASFFSETHDSVIERLAELYVRNISTLGPRIMVKGEPALLQHSRVASRIRALLLAGVRSAVLWRQCGGSRWNLVWRRGELLEACGLALARIEQETGGGADDSQDNEVGGAGP